MGVRRAACLADFNVPKVRRIHALAFFPGALIRHNDQSPLAVTVLFDGGGNFLCGFFVRHQFIYASGASQDGGDGERDTRPGPEKFLFVRVVFHLMNGN